MVVAGKEGPSTLSVLLSTAGGSFGIGANGIFKSRWLVEAEVYWLDGWGSGVVEITEISMDGSSGMSEGRTLALIYIVRKELRRKNKNTQRIINLNKIQLNQG